MIQILRAQKLSQHLGGLTDLVARYERGQLDFTPLALAWLSGAEALLQEERLPEASEVVAARASVLAAKDRPHGKNGTRDKDAVPADSGSAGARRRAQSLAAVDALCLTESLLRKRHVAVEARLEAFEDKLIEAVTALALHGRIPPRQQRAGSAWIEQVWAALVAEPATRPTATWLAAALAAPDRSFLLGKILTRLCSSELPVLVWAREQPDAAAAPEPP